MERSNENCLNPFSSWNQFNAAESSFILPIKYDIDVFNLFVCLTFHQD